MSKIEKQKIYCLDTFPGVGKTTHIIKKLLEFSSNSDSIGYCFYVAPTTLLLAQTRDKLIEKGLEENRVFVIHSDDGSSDRTKVEDRIRYAVSGRYRASPQTYEVNGEKIKSIRTKISEPKPSGSIILMTHEGFLSCCNLNPELKKVITVYFDEARKFVIPSSGKIEIPAGVTRDQVFTLIKQNSSNHLGDYFKVELSGHPEVSQKLDEAISKEGATTDVGRSYLDFRDALDLGRNPLIDLYIHHKDHQDKEGSLYRSDYRFTSVCLPSRVFNGFRYVLLASAYLSHSQMYNMLEKEERNGSLVLIDYLDKQTPETKELNARKAEIYLRFNKLRLIPLTMDDSKISKNKLQNGFILRKENLKYVQGLVSEAGITSSAGLADFLGKYTSLSSREALSKKDRDLGEKFFKVVSADVINFYVNQAKKYFLSKNKYVNGHPLLVVNKQEDLAGEYEDTSYARLYRKKSSSPTGKKYRSIQVKDKFLKPMHPGDFVFTSISSSSQGLNTYIKGNCIAYLAAINPTPQFIELMGLLYPDYKPNKDFAAEAAAQAITRLSVRDTESSDLVYAVVSDMGVVNLLRDKFEEAKIRKSFAESVPYICVSLSNLVAKSQTILKNLDSSQKIVLHKLRKQVTYLKSTLGVVSAAEGTSIHQIKLLEEKLKKANFALAKEKKRLLEL